MIDKNSMPIRVGIIGTGWIGRGLALLLSKRNDMQVSGLLTRRKGTIEDMGVSQDLLIHEPEQLMEKSDIIVVSTGDPVYSTEIIDIAFRYNLPVVTMDADTHVLTGSWLSKHGQITEAEGDQPGCLAALNQEVLDMGFTPLVYGNIKGFLNQNPNVTDMTHWAKKLGFTLNSVTSFTDGTKLQIEQCLIANGLHSGIAKQGLIGERSGNLEDGALALAVEAQKKNKIISDYIISPQAPPGVFIVATHHPDLAKGLETYKMGKGPFYIHYKPIHLCYFEIPKTIKKFYRTREVLLDNGSHPLIGVAAVAKNEILPGTLIDKGIGSFDVRGEAIEISQKYDMLPIGLLSEAHIKRKIEPGQILTFDDVDIPESLALKAWIDSIRRDTPRKTDS